MLPQLDKASCSFMGFGEAALVGSEVWKKRAGRDFKGDMRNVSQLLKWKKEGGKVGQKRKKEESEWKE